MQRRRFLTTAASLGVVGLAGCTGSAAYELVIASKTEGIERIEFDAPDHFLQYPRLSVMLETGISPTPHAWAFIEDGEQADAGDIDTGEYRFETTEFDPRGKTARLIVTHGGEVTGGLISTLVGGNIIEEATFRVEEVTA